MAELAVNLIRPELEVGYVGQPASLPKPITCTEKCWWQRGALIRAELRPSAVLICAGHGRGACWVPCCAV